MTLLKKTLLVVITTVVISTIGLYLASQITLLQGYEKIEQDDTRANVLRVVNSYFDQSQSLNLSARAYAVWDDMYRFVEKPDQAFLDSLGLTPSLYATHKANLMAILDVNYRPIFLKMYDLETLEALEIPSDLSAYLQPGSPLLQHTPDHTEISGLILLDGRPLYVASLASLHTDFTGNPQGAVIFGRYLDDNVVADLSKVTQIQVSAYLLNDSTMPADIAEANTALQSSPPTAPMYVKSLDDKTIAGYTYLKTLENQPAFILKITLPRQIYAQGLTSFRYFAILAAIAGLGFVLVSTLLLHRFVLSPLTTLSKQISLIRASGDNSQRLSVRGKDELANLGMTINGMLQALEKQSEERYRTLVENINDVIFALDTEGYFSYISPVIERLADYTVGEVVGQPFTRFVHPDDIPGLLSSLERTLSDTGEPFEFRVLAKDGTAHYVRTFSRALMLGDKPAGITGVMTDLTQRKRAEQALDESRQYLQAIFNSVNEAIFVHNSAGQILDVNATACRMYGYSREEMLHLEIEALSANAAPYTQVNALNWLTKARGGEPQLFDWWAKTRAGQMFWAEVNIRFAIIGAEERFIVTARDISGRKQTERERENLIQELEKRNAELERFAYTVSHDLKNPLVTIGGFLGFLEKDIQAGHTDRIATDLNRIREAADKMGQLLDELLELSRIGRQMNPPEYISFESIVREALELTYGRLTECGVTVQVAEGLPDVYGDRVRLIEVVQNLVDNAAKYMGGQPQPRIEIGWGEQNGETVFFVKDNGLGIEPQYHQKIFGLFDKLDQHSEGSGIGLALVKRIVEVHGGRIWVESEGMGRGATFCFTLPLERVS